MAFKIHQFKAVIEIIGINPYVAVPDKILAAVFKQAGKEKGHIPIKGEVNGLPYKQTLVKYGGAWRLYINTSMLKNSPGRIGETIILTIVYDSADRTIPSPPELIKALEANPAAKSVFDSLPPSRRHEIVRYIASLKTASSIDKNISRAIGFLTGQGRFVGKDKP